MTRNNHKSETELLGRLAEQLRTMLPPIWRVEVQIERNSQQRGLVDAVVDLAPPSGTGVKLAVEVKHRVQAVDVEPILRQLTAHRIGVPFIYAGFLGQRARERIVELGGNFGDATGNFRLVVADPVLYLQSQGEARDPDPPTRPLASLKGPAAGRVVRALCDLRPPFGVRELATRSGTPAATISRVLQVLTEDALVTRDQRGAVTDVAWDKLLARWVQDHELTKANGTSTWLAPRGLPSVLSKLPEMVDRYTITGSYAAAQLAPVAPPRLLTIYVDDVRACAEKLDLRPADAGANVLLVEPFDPVVYERTLMRDGLVLANPSQVAADLMTSPGRGPAEAVALLAWMKEHEDVWRT
jgi:hypothetical protein